MADEQVVRAKDGGGNTHDLAALLDDAVTYAMRVKATDSDSRLDSVIAELQNVISQLQTSNTDVTTELGDANTELDNISSELSSANTELDNIYTELNSINASVSVSGSQTLDNNNTQVVSSAQASPGSPWIGGWTQTRDNGVVRILTVLAGSTAEIPGTFTFEFTESTDPDTDHPNLGTCEISETRSIGDFDTVRDFDLLNAGAYFRVAFEPTNALGGDLVFITSTLRSQDDGSFVRLANQELEEANAAMGGTFAYLKAFNEETGKSVNIRPDPYDGLSVATRGSDRDNGNSNLTALGADEEWFGQWIDTSSVSAFLVFGYGLAPLDTYEIQWSSDGVNPDTDLLGATDIITSEEVTSGFYVYLSPQTTMVRRYARTHIVNGPTAQTTGFYENTLWRYHGSSYPFTLQAIDETLGSLSSALLTRSVNAGRKPDGTFDNVPIPGVLVSDTFENSGALPSGTTPTFDSSGPIVASNVIDTGWIDVSDYSYQVFHFTSDIAGLKIFLMDASDASGNNSIITSFANPTAISGGTGTSVEVSAQFFNSYFRIVIINDTGSTSNAWNYRSLALLEEPGAVNISLDQPVLPFFPAPITRTVVTGQAPSGLFQNVKTDGLGRSLVTSGSDFARLLARQVENTDELRLDVEPASSDFYIGKNVDGTATSDPSWDIIKISLSATRNPSRIQFVQDAVWDDRTTEF